MWYIWLQIAAFTTEILYRKQDFGDEESTDKSSQVLTFAWKASLRKQFQLKIQENFIQL